MTTVGIVGLGVMGSAVAARMSSNGVDVVGIVAGRSQATRARARSAGIAEVGTLEDLVARADLVMSIMGSAAAVEFATELERAVAGAVGKVPAFAECNLIAPEAMRRIDASLTRHRVEVVDAAIVGPPPNGAHSPCVYVAGPHAERLLFLRELGFRVDVVSERNGDASALKVCSAAVWQGCLALTAQVAIAAKALGVDAAWRNDLQLHQTLLHDWFLPAVLEAPERSERWQGDMTVIGDTLAAVAADPRYHAAAADLYGRLARLPRRGWRDVSEIVACLDESED